MVPVLLTPPRPEGRGGVKHLSDTVRVLDERGVSFRSLTESIDTTTTAWHGCRVPLTALHGDASVLDATMPDLGAGLAWDRVHRARPRAPLTCTGCGAGLHAKQSHGGVRFFAHDRAQSGCPLNGESPKHRLLKAALAAAIRDAGWHAGLEVAGVGDSPWRADVLATSPDGCRRVAFEAQLSAITPDEIVARTANLAASGVEVCWVAERNVPWLGHVPYFTVTPQDRLDLLAEIGIWRFTEGCCPNRRDCEYPGPMTFFSGNRSKPQPCLGHGHWDPVPKPLATAVRYVCDGSIKPHDLRGTSGARLAGKWVTLENGGPGQWGHIGWTAPHYIRLAAAQDAAIEEHEAAQAREGKEAAAREANFLRLAARQEALRMPAVRAVARQAEQASRSGGSDPKWAGGIPITGMADGKILAVICPVASRVTSRIRQRLADVLIVVASDQERSRLAQHCVTGQRFLLLEPEDNA